MLILTRKQGESVVIGGDIQVMVVEIRGDSVRLGIQASPEIPVHREEVQQQINAAARGTDGTP